MDQFAADVTVVEVLHDLRDSGFTGEFYVGDDGALCCRACGFCQAAEQASADGVRRVEGASDPGDMAAVLAVTCPRCGQRGAAVVRYGPEASADEAALLTGIDHRPATPTRSTGNAEDSPS